ncbi:ABC-type spermidine/putrescine transport systems, ATPase components [Escherichia coli]|uniref:ABC-type spermidine/putrescine transport systems, ATPase components n=1 Tax=Escherichia coli TaxID=562 RepID=A0A2X1JGU9_ECOLX|nr:ABC-type spermidine/putrescine transport systems, ATPase components [Escherichia coli]
MLDGVDLSQVPPYLRPINMMFQSYALFPHMTVEQNIAFGLKQDKLPKAEIASRVNEMLGLVHMQGVRQTQTASAFRRSETACGAGPKPCQAPKTSAARRTDGRAG